MLSGIENRNINVKNTISGVLVSESSDETQKAINFKKKSEDNSSVNLLFQYGINLKLIYKNKLQDQIKFAINLTLNSSKSNLIHIPSAFNSWHYNMAESLSNIY